MKSHGHFSFFPHKHTHILLHAATLLHSSSTHYFPAAGSHSALFGYCKQVEPCKISFFFLKIFFFFNFYNVSGIISAWFAFSHISEATVGEIRHHIVWRQLIHQLSTFFTGNFQLAGTILLSSCFKFFFISSLYRV